MLFLTIEAITRRTYWRAIAATSSTELLSKVNWNAMVRIDPRFLVSLTTDPLETMPGVGIAGGSSCD